MLASVAPTSNVIRWAGGLGEFVWRQSLNLEAERLQFCYERKCLVFAAAGPIHGTLNDLEEFGRGLSVDWHWRFAFDEVEGDHGADGRRAGKSFLCATPAMTFLLTPSSIPIEVME